MTNMSNIADLHRYKTAKIVVKDLYEIINILNNVKRDLNTYHRYLPVQDVENSIKNSLILINLHLHKYQDILNNKGLINDKME